MGNFQRFSKGRDNRGSGERKFGGGGNFSGGPKPMHQAICGQCGQNCSVPFRPSGERPVFCQDCFKNKNDSAPRFAPKSFEARRPAPTNYAGAGATNSNNTVTKAAIDSLNAKLDKIITLLTIQTQPTQQAAAPIKNTIQKTKTSKNPDAKSTSPKSKKAKPKKK